jgi:hypothetical protein
MKFSQFSRGSALVLFCLAIPREVMAGDFHLRLVPTRNPKEVISDLNWDGRKETQEPLLQKRKKPVEKNGDVREGSTYFVELHGNYQKKGRSLLFNKRPIQRAVQGNFTIEVDIKSEHQEFTISEIDEAGKVKTQKNELFFSKFGKINSTTKEPDKKKWSVSPGLGVTLATYQQTGFANFTETALTVKVAADYAIAGRWDVGGSAYYTLLPLTATQKDMTLTFLGLNLRAGCRLLKSESVWGLSLMAGIYYATTFAKGTFGYHNVQGPQIYPTLSRKFSGEKSAWLYLKYSPIFDGTDFVSLANAELAMGGGFTVMAFSRGQTLAATLDVALLSLQVSSAFTVQSNSYSLGLNYRF